MVLIRLIDLFSLSTSITLFGSCSAPAPKRPTFSRMRLSSGPTGSPSIASGVPPRVVPRYCASRSSSPLMIASISTVSIGPILSISVRYLTARSSNTSSRAPLRSSAICFFCGPSRFRRAFWKSAKVSPPSKPARTAWRHVSALKPATPPIAPGTPWVAANLAPRTPCVSGSMNSPTLSTPPATLSTVFATLETSPNRPAAFLTTTPPPMSTPAMSDAMPTGSVRSFSRIAWGLS